MLQRTLILFSLFVAAACGEKADTTPPSTDSPAVPHKSFEGEKHLHNIRQITFGGENAEAYWSQDGAKLIFQSKRDGRPVLLYFTFET